MSCHDPAPPLLQEDVPPGTGKPHPGLSSLRLVSKDEKTDLVVHSHPGRGRGTGDRRPRPGRRCSQASSPGSPSSRGAETRAPKGERGGVPPMHPEEAPGAGPPATSPRGRTPAPRPAPRADRLYSQQPSAARHAPRQHLPGGRPAPAIPRRRFHSAFVRKPEDADAAEGLRRRPSDPERSGGAGRGPVLMLRAAREAKGEAAGR